MTPPPASDLSGRGKGEFGNYVNNGWKPHLEDTEKKSSGRSNLTRPETEPENGGDSSNGRKGKMSQAGSRLISTVSAVYQEKGGNDSEPDGDKWSDDDDESEDDGGVKLS